MTEIRSDLLIGVVGNCTAGKTTLVEGLARLGYRAVNIAQEHSTAPRLWQRKNPDFLVFLSSTLETSRLRREIYWGQERLDDQWQRLSHARAHADLDLPTDNLTIEEVLNTVVAAVERKKAGQRATACTTVQDDKRCKTYKLTKRGGTVYNKR
jgi:hypothetical protein